MVETIGKKLCQARIARGLSIEEAAHITRVRPDKLVALENDDYSRFGSNAYAKGFLQIYGRFLSIDVSHDAKLLETPHQVSISDYQYLNNAPEPTPTKAAAPPGWHHSRRRSMVPLVLMALAAMIMVGVVFAFWYNVTTQRLEPAPKNRKPAPEETATSDQTEVQPAEKTPQTNAPANAVAANGAPELRTGTAGERAPGVNEAEPQVEIRRAEAVNPASAAPAPGSPASEAAAAAIAASGKNEISVEPLKKTYVKIRKDSPTNAPYFEDYLYPGGPPLVLRGTKFFIEVRDPDAVQIRKNGSPIAYQAPGISIQ